jgi:hypothetical protein
VILRITSLLVLEDDKSIKGKNPEYTDAGLMEGIDEEDHEAISNGVKIPRMRITAP